MVDVARARAGAQRGGPAPTGRMRRWSPRILPTVAVLAFSAAFIGWAAADPTSQTRSPVDDVASPPPSGAATVAPPSTASPSPDASPPATVAPARRTTPPVASTPPVPDRSLFTRTDPPPNGVPARIGRVTGGDSRCSEIVVEPGPPAVVVAEGPAELPVVAMACLVNFDPTRPVRATVTPPTGPARTTTVEPTDLDYFDVSFLLRPGDTAGTYTVTAEQGDLYATARTVVARPTAERLWRDSRAADILMAGESVELLLAGFPVGRPATLHLYRSDDPGSQASYRTSFTVPIDPYGNAEVTIATPSTLRSGCYVLTIDAVRVAAQATHGSAVAFCVTAR